MSQAIATSRVASLPDLDGARVVELSHTIVPGKEEYRLEVATKPVAELLPDYKGKAPKGAWYVMSEVQHWSHVGTHMETALHVIADGADITSVTLDRAIGTCQLVDFTDKKVGEGITLAELRERGAGIEVGDIVFVRTGHGHYRTAESHDRPYFEPEAIRWLAEDRKISLLGVDCSGIENRTAHGQPNHLMLFTHGIPLIEHLAHLDELRTNRFFVVAVPWRVVGLEASNVSVIAFEPRAEQ
jgi:arylformamidase